MVNAPLNAVFIGGQVELVTAGIISYSSFIRSIEHVMVLKDVVITMGSETVIPSGFDPMAGQTIQRRYSNIWIKEKGNWVLKARHANNICDAFTTSRSPNFNQYEAAVNDMNIKVRNNPSSYQFELYVESKATKSSIRITDINERLIENLQIAKGIRTVSLGANYRSGIYIATITSGEYTKAVKLVKL